MKPSKLEMTLSLLGSVFGMLAVFAEPLGLSETLRWAVLIFAPVCFIPLIVMQRRRRNARLAAGLPPTEKSPSKRRFWLFIILFAAVSLTGPVWLPYTGVTLPTSTLIITSILSFATAVLVFVLSWRYWNKKV
jgi:hypothetical protein